MTDLQAWNEAKTARDRAIAQAKKCAKKGLEALARKMYHEAHWHQRDMDEIAKDMR
jgi:hypothetical protein